MKTVANNGMKWRYSCNSLDYVVVERFAHPMKCRRMLKEQEK